MTSTPPAPPRLAVALLGALLAPTIREAYLGDLEECFRTRIVPERGVGAGRRWYWREALAAPFLAGRRSAQTSAQPDGEPGMSQLGYDVRYGLRLLARSPAFTAVAAFTLALSIGATTAIYSAVYPMLLAPLPYPEPERVVLVSERGGDGLPSNVGWQTFDEMSRRSRSFAAVAAVGRWTTAISGDGAPARLEGQRVSTGFLSVLGVRPALGRDFRPDDDLPNGERVAILSHALWRGRFGGDSSLIGRPITLDGAPFTVIGVMPATFENVLNPHAQLWTPLRYNATLAWACRTCRHLRVVGRLAPGVARETAHRELNAISASLRAAYPADYPAAGTFLPTLKEQVTEGVRPALLAVLGAVSLLLLIACANVTNLLLARAAQRRGELSLRAALGAGRGRLVRQLLIESIVLAAVGGALGIGLAFVGVRGLVALAPAGLPRLDAIRVNGPVLGFALAVTSVVGIVVGLLPALHASREDLHDSLKRHASRTAARRHRARGALVVVEVALALVLLVGSGLLLRSMTALLAVAPGFDTARLLTLEVEASGPRFASDTATHAYFAEVLRSVREVPGVVSAALTTQLPLSGDFDAFGVVSERHPPADPADAPAAHRYAVSAGYLETMGIPVVRGRSLAESDRAGAPLVALIGRSFAERIWGNDDPIGQRIRVGGPQAPWRTIVGITGDVKQVSLSAERSDGFYVPEAQWLWADVEQTVVVRTRGEPAAMVNAVREAIWSVDRNQPIERIATMDHLVAETAAERRFTLILFEVFALVALVLSAAGIYAVLSGSVTERTREIGVRSALGASRGSIMGLVVGQGLRLALVGIAVGLVAAAGLSRLLTGLLFGVSALDAGTFGLVTVGLGSVALFASWIPAWRAARVNPIQTLRAD